MTSMPASRSALATTLAPRSWPSSPGLATTTRMRPCATVPAPLLGPPPPAPLRCRAAPGKILPGHRAAPTPGSRRTIAVPTSDPPPRRPGRDPGGRVAYLPPRAAKARKLILRSQLGRGWIVASALFGLVILVAGVLFLARDGHPGPPWVRVAPLSSLPDGAVTEAPGPRPGGGRGGGFPPPLRRPPLGPGRRPGQQPPRRPGGPSPAAPGPGLLRRRRPVRQPWVGPVTQRGQGRPSSRVTAAPNTSGPTSAMKSAG